MKGRGYQQHNNSRQQDSNNSNQNEIVHARARMRLLLSSQHPQLGSAAGSDLIAETERRRLQLLEQRLRTLSTASAGASASASALGAPLSGASSTLNWIQEAIHQHQHSDLSRHAQERRFAQSRVQSLLAQEAAVERRIQQLYQRTGRSSLSSSSSDGNGTGTGTGIAQNMLLSTCSSARAMDNSALLPTLGLVGHSGISPLPVRPSLRRPRDPSLVQGNLVAASSSTSIRSSHPRKTDDEKIGPTSIRQSSMHLPLELAVPEQLMGQLVETTIQSHPSGNISVGTDNREAKLSDVSERATSADMGEDSVQEEREQEDQEDTTSSMESFVDEEAYFRANPNGLASSFTIAIGDDTAESTDDNDKKKRPPMKRAREPFPLKLYRILFDAAKHGNEDIISFSDNGKSFFLHQPEKFVSDIMPKYFAAPCKKNTFFKQINLYGFKRISASTACGPDRRGGYWHPRFVRGNLRLCLQIRRKKTFGLVAKKTTK